MEEIFRFTLGSLIAASTAQATKKEGSCVTQDQTPVHQLITALTPVT